jgi:hypothetical protein
MTFRSRRTPRPNTPLDDFYSTAALPKRPRPETAMDTSSLPQRKIHPLRDRAFLDWLRKQPCAIKGLTNESTGQPHVCWSPDRFGAGFLSDPAHCGKSYSGKLKRSDAEAFPLCRHGHRDQEPNMNLFDARYGIDRFEIAARMYAEYQHEKERRS